MEKKILSVLRRRGAQAPRACRNHWEFGLFLMLVLMAPAMSWAETPDAPVPSEQVRHSDDLGQSSTVTEKKDSPVPKKVVGTAYDESALTVLPGSPGLSSNRGTTVEQARRSDDLGPSSTATASLPEVKTYEELRQAISQARAASRVRVEKAVEQERVQEAWEIGRLIDTHVLQHKERADYGKGILERLSTDLGMNERELYYMLELYRTYPTARPAAQLSWSHYKALLAVNDPKERKVLAEQAEKENWSRDRLREEVRNVTKGGKAVPAEVLTARPGKPGTYRVILAQTGPYEGELVLDLGFSNYIQLAKVVGDVSPFKEGEVLEFSDEQGEVRSLNAVHRTPYDFLYTYQAWVNRVLDGDTIEATIDLGFGFTTTQTLRLRAIDAPEIQTRDGMEAREFVEKALQIPGNGERGTQAKAGAQVLIKTSRSDKYDRYLADVFITDKNGEEQYLNNLLLEKGYAVKVRE
ncbi:MAG: DUF1016 N-terminal domain-containing protein [Candidatus Omnitrophota bacterium]